MKFKIYVYEYNLQDFRQNIMYNDMLMENIDMTTIPTAYQLEESLAPIEKIQYGLYLNIPEADLPCTYFINVFQLTLWIAFFSTLFLTILFLFFYKKILNCKINLLMLIYYINGIVPDLENQDIKLFKSFHLCHTISAIFQFMIASAFSAFLVSELSIIINFLPFNDLDGILDQDDYSLCLNTFEIPYEILKDQKIVNRENCVDLSFNTEVPRIQVICNSTKAIYMLMDFVINDEIPYFYNK